MTNSTPKLNNKVERQGSPNTNGKRQRLGKSTTYFTNSGNKKINNGRLSCSPPFGKNMTSSPLRHEHSPVGNNNGSPTNSSFYAGAKFSEPPSPASLPKPPSHWTSRFIITSCQRSSETCCSMTNHLKMLLNVQA